MRLIVAGTPLNLSGYGLGAYPAKVSGGNPLITRGVGSGGYGLSRTGLLLYGHDAQIFTAFNSF